jgi:hypothetical protein
LTDAPSTAIGWRCTTPTTAGSCRPINSIGGIGRIKPVSAG